MARRSQAQKKKRAPQNGATRTNGNNGNRNGNAGRVRSQAAPLQNLPSLSRPVKGPNTVLTGVDFITRLNVKSRTEILSPKDRILLAQPISATSFSGTRVSALSQLWERYRWHKAICKYIPAVPNTVACQLVAYIDTDPLDDPSVVTKSDDIVRQAVAQAGSRQWNFNQRMDIPLAIRADDQFYYTGVDKQNIRFSQQGVLYIIQVTDLLDFNGSPVASGYECGSVLLDWSVCFNTPQINPSFVYPAPTVDAEFELAGTITFPQSDTIIISLEEDERYLFTIAKASVEDNDTAGDADVEVQVSIEGAEQTVIIGTVFSNVVDQAGSFIATGGINAPKAPFVVGEANPMRLYAKLDGDPYTADFDINYYKVKVTIGA